MYDLFLTALLIKSEVFWDNTVSAGEQLEVFRRVLLPPPSGLQDDWDSNIFRNVCNHQQVDSHHVPDEFSIHSFKTPHH
jgi:hypothetical protein